MGCVRRTQHGDEDDYDDDDNYDDDDDNEDDDDGDDYEEDDDEEDEEGDDDEIYLGAGSATSGVVLTNTGAGFFGSGGVAV